MAGLDDYAQLASGELDVIEIEVALAEKGLHEIADAVDDGHAATPPLSYERRGHWPTPSLDEFERNGR